MAKQEEKSPMAEDTALRILLATDNHLGAHELDEVRSNDSFRTFEEILNAAKKERVDAIVLAGDLFHDNHPSRKTLRKAIRSISDSVCGQGDVAFKVVSDQASDFPSAGAVNFEDPNHQIELPIFIIHGNHDDPSGPDGSSALDVLSDAKLINYFGRQDVIEREDGGGGPGQIRVRPVLLEKGSARIAMYGIGHIRDSRLKHIFEQPEGVQFIQPTSEPNRPQGSWLNMLLLHQNRSQNSPNALPETYVPTWMDLCVWGHEHECQLGDSISSTMRNNAGAPDGGCCVLQLGSSVQTSLEEGESAQKRVAILEVKQSSEWRVKPLPITSIRPFYFKKVCLADENVDESLDADTMAQEIDGVLERKARELISTAENNRRPEQPELPLIRLRVDYTGYTTINCRQFGQRFVQQVANPHDMIAFHKQKRATRKGEWQRQGGEGTTEAPELLEGRDEANKREIEQFLRDHLGQLQVLQADHLTTALNRFVEKDDRNAFSSVCSAALKEIRASMLSEQQPENVEQDDFNSRLQRANAGRQPANALLHELPEAQEPDEDEQRQPRGTAEEEEEQEQETTASRPQAQSTMDALFSSEAASLEQKRPSQPQRKGTKRGRQTDQANTPASTQNKRQRQEPSGQSARSTPGTASRQKRSYRGFGSMRPAS